MFENKYTLALSVTKDIRKKYKDLELIHLRFFSKTM